MTTNANFFPVFFCFSIVVAYSLFFHWFFFFGAVAAFHLKSVNNIATAAAVDISVKSLMHDNHVTTKKKDKISFNKKNEEKTTNRTNDSNKIGDSSHFIESTFTLCNFFFYLSHSHSHPRTQTTTKNSARKGSHFNNKIHLKCVMLILLLPLIVQRYFT